MQLKMVEWTFDKVWKVYRANTPIGWYIIEEQFNASLGKFWILSQLMPKEFVGRTATLEEAKEIVQRDFNRRIIDCVEG